VTEDRWFIQLGIEELGPVTSQELRILARRGAVKHETLVSSDRITWQDAETVTGLCFNSARSPPHELHNQVAFPELSVPVATNSDAPVSADGQVRRPASVEGPVFAPAVDSRTVQTSVEAIVDDRAIKPRLEHARKSDSWHIKLGSDTIGPLTSAELRNLAGNGSIRPETPVSCNLVEWSDAASVQGLTFRPTAPPPLPTRPTTGRPAASAGFGRAENRWLAAGKSQARMIVNDFRKMDFHRDVVPLNADSLKLLTKDFGFWIVLLLGTVPLLIGTFANQRAQLAAFAFFFAIVWGVVFKVFILRDSGDWKTPLAALLFTGIVGSIACRIFEQILFANGTVSFFGWVLGVGVCEELCKIVPVVGYVLWTRSAAKPFTVVLIGVFSGLGFAAFENLLYNAGAVARSYEWASSYGPQGLEVGVQQAMVETLVRSLGTVFGHAVWSGTFACFIATALVLNRGWGAHFLLGLGVVAIVHGVYDWLWSLQPTVAALMAAASFVMLWGYLTRLRELIAATDASEAPTGESCEELSPGERASGGPTILRAAVPGSLSVGADNLPE
jgi:RsiW-degrading membrane proteinase PrsW (M82 family)